LANADFICGGFLSCGPHVYTPEIRVFYRNIVVRHQHIFPLDPVYEQLTRTGWLVVRLEPLEDIPDAPVFEFVLSTNCLAAVKRDDLVHVFTEGDMAGGVIDGQVSSTHTAALFLVHGYWFLRESPFHVSGWFHICVSACFALVPGHAMDNQRDHWFITNKAKGEQPKSFWRFYSKPFTIRTLLFYSSSETAWLYTRMCIVNLRGGDGYLGGLYYGINSCRLVLVLIRLPWLPVGICGVAEGCIAITMCQGLGFQLVDGMNCARR
jgi:hypothetical protein